MALRAPGRRVLQHLREHRRIVPPEDSPFDPYPTARDLLAAPVASTGSPPRRSPRAMTNHQASTYSGSLPDPLPLVGRATELAELEALLEDADGRTSIVFLRGESGVGKSRLAAELSERASRRSWKVAKGRAYPVETGVPYALFSDAWLPVLREMDSSKLTVLSRGGEHELRYLFPALDSAYDDIEGIGSEDPEEFRTRLMWNFAEFVKRYAKQEPVLCVLEDLQWADESSMQLIHFLARQVSGHPVLLVCTYNDQERDRSPHLIQTERSLASMDVGRVMQLQALTLDQATELVSRSFGVDGDSVREFSAVLFGWTRGNPFFAEEIVKSMVASGRIHRDGGTWVGWDAKEFGMPGSVRDAVIQRMLTFSEPAQVVAELAAIVGTRASYPLLEAVSGLESSELLAALEELCALRFLDERAEHGEVVFHFAHPLVRQILYGEFGLARAQVLHGVVAEAMEAHYGADAMEHADELAFHFARTDSAHLRAKAARYLAAAGRRALERRADTEAINYLQAAMDRAAASGSDQAPSLAEMVPLLARAQTHVGNFEGAIRLWTRALDAVPADSPEHAAVRRTLGMTHFWAGGHDEAHEHLDAGLEIAGRLGDEASTVRLLVAKAHCLHEVGRGAEALETLQRALPLAEGLGRKHLLARVHRALALLHLWVGPPEAAERHGEKAIELAQEVDDLSIEFWARWGLAVHIGMRGDTARLETAVEQVRELADRIRSPVLRLWTADMAIELAFAKGEWDRGIMEGNQVIEIARALNQRTVLPRLLVWTSLFYVCRGDFDRAQELVSEAERISGLDRLDSDTGVHDFDVHQVVPTCIGKAHYLVGLGDFEEAIAVAEKGLQIAEGTGYILWAVHRLLPILAEACLWADHVERAESVGRRMRAHAERIDHRLGLAWSDACDALVRWKRGDTEGSIPLMHAASDELDSIPMIWPAARLRRQLAARYWELERPDEAKRELDRVWEVLVQVGAGEEKEKARADYKKMGLRAPTEHRTGGPLGLTPEEVEVARLAAQGMSNPEIAAARKSKVRTVSTHLTNIYKKLGIGGGGARIRLGNMVREAGLLD